MLGYCRAPQEDSLKRRSGKPRLSTRIQWKTVGFCLPFQKAVLAITIARIVETFAPSAPLAISAAQKETLCKKPSLIDLGKRIGQDTSHRAVQPIKHRHHSRQTPFCSGFLFLHVRTRVIFFRYARSLQTMGEAIRSESIPAARLDFSLLRPKEDPLQKTL